MLPQILTVNPMAKRHARRRSSSRKRKNPMPAALRRYHARKAHRSSGRRRGRARHRARNPFSIGSFSPKSLVSNSLLPAGIGAGGAIAADIALAYLPLPTFLQTGIGNTIAKILAALGVGFAVGKVAGKNNGHVAALGGLTIVAYSTLKSYLAPTLGTSVKGLSGLADFQDYRIGPDSAMGAYMRPGQVAPFATGMGAYMPAGQSALSVSRTPLQTRQMGAYMNPGSFLSGGYSEDQ